MNRGNSWILTLIEVSKYIAKFRIYIANFELVPVFAFEQGLKNFKIQSKCFNSFLESLYNLSIKIKDHAFWTELVVYHTRKLRNIYELYNANIRFFLTDYSPS